MVSKKVRELFGPKPPTDAPDNSALRRLREVYYRLEESTIEPGARPFRYRLRRLEAGVTGRNVILYKSDDASVRE